jgi:iron complex transport system substrate-binding protein
LSAPSRAVDTAAREAREPVPAPGERIVSLFASGTELVCALGAGARLVGRSHECDFPPWVRRLPAVSRPTFDIGGSSRDIDARVRARLAAGEPLYEVDEQLLADLAPGVVITQTQCEVCAVTPADLAHARPGKLLRQQAVALRGGSIDGILDGFITVADLIGLPTEGRVLVSGIRARMAALAEAARALGRPRPSVVCLEWIDPVFPMGNWSPELIDLAGAEDRLGAAGVHSTTEPWEAVCEADPEFLIVAPCGFPIERTVAEMPALAARPGWRQLRAVRDQHVFVVDGNLYFNRSGPSVFTTPEILAEILHPDRFAPRREGTAWLKWTG